MYSCPLGRRLAADLPRGIHGILRLNRADDFRNSDRKFGQLVGLDPQPHRVLARAENLHASNAIKASDLVGQD